MKRNITLSIDEELIAELRKTESQSGTVNNVLQDFFRLSKSPQEVKESLTKEIGSKLEELDKAQTEIDKQVKVYHESQERERLEEIEYRKTPQYFQKMLNQSKEVVERYEIGELDAEKLAQEMTEAYVKQGIRPFEFMKNLNLQPKKRLGI